jgi:cytochrome P450
MLTHSITANPVDDDKVVDLMSAMMKIKDEETPLTDQDIIDQCLTFLFAGHDTTGSRYNLYHI